MRSLAGRGRPVVVPLKGRQFREKTLSVSHTQGQTQQRNHHLDSFPDDRLSTVIT